MAYDLEKVKRIIEKAKGQDRTMQKYAQDAGISNSTLSRILNGNREINMKHIQLLTSDAANPRNGVTLEEMATEAGFVNIINNPLDITGNDDINSEDEKELGFIISGVLQKILAGKLLKYEVVNSSSRWYSPDLVINMIDDKSQYEWWFEIKSFKHVSNERLMISIQNLLCKLLPIKPDANRVLTIIVDTEAAYERLSCFKDELAYKGNLSIVLFDKDSYTLSKEVFISQYGETEPNLVLF